MASTKSRTSSIATSTSTTAQPVKYMLATAQNSYAATITSTTASTTQPAAAQATEQQGVLVVSDSVTEKLKRIEALNKRSSIWKVR